VTPEPGAGSARRPLAFFALIVLLSLPFWIIGAAAPRDLMPGLPVSGLAVLAPFAAAAILTYREAGPGAVAALLERAVDFRGIGVWYLPIVLLAPGAAIISYGILRATHVPLPDFDLSLAGALALFAVFLIAAMAEEVGFSGYATDPMVARWGALVAAIMIGAAWALWHIIALIQTHRPAAWIAWWGVGTIASRVLIVWLYVNTGKSVAGASVYHAMSNLSWQLFPNRGSHFDPRVNALVLLLAATIVTIVWTPKTLRR